MVVNDSFLFLAAKLPVTSLCFYAGSIFVGIGGCLKLYKLDEQKKVGDESKVYQVFRSSSIHILKTFKLNENEDFLLCLGGKNVGCFSLKESESEIEVTNNFSQRCSDWILDGTCTHKSGTPYLALVLAHNSVVLYDMKSQLLEVEVHCTEKCILYSAKIINSTSESWEDLMLCSGTVFNQIVVWKPSSNPNNQNRIEPLDYIKGHDGVIFAIEYQHETQLLFSASDDRSIRVRRCSLMQNNGYSCDDVSRTCTAYGHEARIWSLRTYFTDVDQNKLLSVAEDGLCIIWNIQQENNEQIVSLSITKRMNFNSNNLSLDVNCFGKFAVGNIDGSVRVLTLDEHSTSPHLTQVPPICLGCEEKDGIFGAIKTISLLDGANVLAHTDAGLLAVYNINTQAWKRIYQNDNYSSYSCMKVMRGNNLLALGNTKGSLLVMELNENQRVEHHVEIEAFQGKVFCLTWNKNYNLFCSGPNGRINRYSIENCSWDSNNLQVLSTFQLPNKLKWHTCSLVLNNCDFIVFGDRRGSVHLYQASVSENPLHTLRCIHGKNGVTSVNEMADNLLISTGRDGTWKILSVSHSRLQLLITNRAAQGMDWIDNFHWCSGDSFDTGKLYFYGFHSNKFIVWSRSSGDQLFTIQCGGGHRSWDFSFLHRRLVFLKAGQLNVVNIPRHSLSESVVCPSLHSQQIQNVAILNVLKHPLHGEVAIVATSSDDTKIKISITKTKTNAEIAVLRTLDDHNSNVRFLKCLRSDDVITLMSCGSKSCINVYQLNSDDYTAMSLRKLCEYKAKKIDSSRADVRYMSLDCFSFTQKDGGRLAVARSDATVETMEVTVNEDSYTINSTGTSQQFNNCFLTVKVDEERIYSGATDGRIYVFNWSCHLLHSFIAHQSGVNSMITRNLQLSAGEEGKTVMVITGGDDNAITTTLLSCARDEKVTVANRGRLENVHSGQVTGLELTQIDDCHHEYEMISASIDQRLFKWQLKLVDGASAVDLRCEVMGATLTDVSDVSCLAAYEDYSGGVKLCVIGGCGLVSYRIM